MPTLQPGGFLLGAGQVPVKLSRYTQGLARALVRVTRWASPSPPSGLAVQFPSRPVDIIAQAKGDVNTFLCKETVKFYRLAQDAQGTPPSRDPEGARLVESAWSGHKGEGMVSGRRPSRLRLEGLGGKILSPSGTPTSQILDILNKIC